MRNFLFRSYSPFPRKRSTTETGTRFENRVRRDLEKKGYHDFRKPPHRYFDWLAKNRNGKTVAVECKQAVHQKSLCLKVIIYQ